MVRSSVMFTYCYASMISALGLTTNKTQIGGHFKYQRQINKPDF